MKSVNSIKDQNLLDVAVEQNGNVLSTIDVALANDMSITDDAVVGQELSVPPTSEKKEDVVNYFEKKGHKVVTSREVGEFATLQGINVWALGIDFEVK